jgi:hypothetical protein
VLLGHGEACSWWPIASCFGSHGNRSANAP